MGPKKMYKGRGEQSKKEVSRNIFGDVLPVGEMV